jgi:hypothetical protein
MLEQGCEYHAYCQECDEPRRIDLQRLVRIKQGDKLSSVAGSSAVAADPTAAVG